MNQARHPWRILGYRLERFQEKHFDPERTTDDFLARPKGQWSRTFDRNFERHAALVDRVNEADMAEMKSVLRAISASL